MVFYRMRNHFGQANLYFVIDSAAPLLIHVGRMGAMITLAGTM